MDFHSLSRRDLQFFCKKNKIPANMTNISMADALIALEIVEGVDEFANQEHSPTSVAKNLPSAARTAARTTRRKAKDETEPSDLVTRSCYVTSKSLAGEMEQENRNTNVLQIPSVPQSRRSAAATSVAKKLEVADTMPEDNVSKTPAARTTRRAQAAASSKKDESVQRVYSTRRAVKLLEESMADLCLKTAPAKKRSEDAAKEDSPAGSKTEAESVKVEEAEVISVRDLNDSLEKEWGDSKNDPDLDTLYGDLGDITFSDANTSKKEQTNGIESKTVPASDSFVIVEEQETAQEDDFVVVDHAASTTTNIVVCNKEPESEEMKNGSEAESEETEYETDSSEDDDVQSEDSKPEEEELCESDEMIDNESEVDLVSDKMKTQASSVSPLAKKEVESESDGWSSEFEIEDISEMEEAYLSDNKNTPAKSQPASLFADDSDNKNKENVEEMVVNNNGDRESEAEDKKMKKKTIDEESLKDVSMRQLTKMVKELAIKSSKQQHKSLE